MCLKTCEDLILRKSSGRHWVFHLSRAWIRNFNLCNLHHNRRISRSHDHSINLVAESTPWKILQACFLPVPLILDTFLRGTCGGRPTVKQAQTHPSLPVNWKVDKSKIRLALKMAVPWKSPYCEAGGVSWMRHVRLSPSKTIPSKSLNSIYVGTGPPAPFSPNE